MNKKGLQHVEIILSFVIFVGFLLFALYFFNPINTDRVLDSSLFYTIDEIKKNTSVEVEEYSVVIRTGVTEENVAVQLQEPLSNKVRVESQDGIRLSGRYDEGSDRVEFSRAGNNFVKFLFSDEFNSQDAVNQPTQLESSMYSISSSERGKIISERLMKELNQSYYSNYEGLKEEFNIPRRVEFAFQLIMADGTISAQNYEPVGVDVFSEGKRMEILREDGSMVFADFVVRVW